MLERSKVPLNKWLHVIHLVNREQMTPTQLAQTTGLAFKTVEKIRARIYAAVNTYDGPNTIFGPAITSYISSRRPQLRGVKAWYRWRAKHPKGETIPADGSLGRVAALKGIDRTERLVRLLLRTPKPT